MTPFLSNANTTIRDARGAMAQAHRCAWLCVSLARVVSFAKGDT